MESQGEILNLFEPYVDPFGIDRHFQSQNQIVVSLTVPGTSFKGNGRWFRRFR